MSARRPIAATADAQARFEEVVRRSGGYLTEMGQATADCPACDRSRALSITYDERGVGINCNARRESDYDGRADVCTSLEISLALGLTESDLFAPTRPRNLSRPNGFFVAMRPDLRVITGSAQAALVLQQLLFWYSRATLYRRGRWWVAKNHPVLAEETGVGESAVRKVIIPALIEDGFIVMLDSSFAGKRCPWYSINEEAIERAIARTMS